MKNNVLKDVVINDSKDIKDIKKSSLGYLHFATIINGHKTLPIEPCSLGGQRSLCGGKRWASCHAELNALKHIPRYRLNDYKYCNKLTMVVVRFDSVAAQSGRWLLIDSKPCFHCLENMKRLGIKRVLYSCTGSSLLIKGNVETLIRDGDYKVSHGHRQHLQLVDTVEIDLPLRNTSWCMLRKSGKRFDKFQRVKFSKLARK